MDNTILKKVILKITIILSLIVIIIIAWLVFVSIIVSYNPNKL